MDAKVYQSEIPDIYDSMSKFYDIWVKLGESRARNRSNPRFEKVKEWVLKIHESGSEHHYT